MTGRLILFHNAGSALGASVLLGTLLRRNPRAWLLSVFAFTMHIVEDYVTVAWNQNPWRPFADTAVNLGDHLPVWIVQGVFQGAAMLFVLGTTVLIYRKHGRTGLETISSKLDRVLAGYALRPWRNRTVL